MHILMLTDIPFGTGSWIGRYMPLASQLGRRGHRVTILMTNPEPKLNGYPLKNVENVFIYETGIPYWKKVNDGRSNYSTVSLCKIGIQNIINSLRLLLRLKPDIMIICKPLPIAATVGLFFKIVIGKRIIIDCDDAEVAINSVRSNLQRNIIHIFESIVPRLSDGVLVNSEYIFNRVKALKIAEKKITYIPNGVDVERFSNFSPRPLERELVGKKIILYYGDLNFASGHNIDVLLRAFKIVLSKSAFVKLLIIGDGTDEGKLKQEAVQLGIAENVIWKGRIAPEEIPHYLFYCDVVIDPVRDMLSNWARCPVKIIEAMFMGKSVVTSDIGERKTLLGDFGFFAKEGDPYSMADKILEVLNNREFAKKKDLLIKRGLSYSWESLSRQVEACLIKVLEK